MTPTPTPPPAPPALVLTPDLLASALLTLLAVCVLMAITVVLARLARGATMRALQRTRADTSTMLLIGRAASIAVLVVGGLIALGVVGVAWTTVLALTSVLGLAASLALQDVLKNFVAGVYLLVERPFRIGEAIKVKDFVGRVETVGIRTTILRADDGALVVVPNAILFAEVILNRGLPQPQTGTGPLEDPARV